MEEQNLQNDLNSAGQNLAEQPESQNPALTPDIQQLISSPLIEQPSARQDDITTTTVQPTAEMQPRKTEESTLPVTEYSKLEEESGIPEWLKKARAAAEEEKRVYETKIDKIENFLKALQDPDMQPFIEKAFNNTPPTDTATKWVDNTLGQSNPTIATAQDANLKTALSSVQPNNAPEQQSA